MKILGLLVALNLLLAAPASVAALAVAGPEQKPQRLPAGPIVVLGDSLSAGYRLPSDQAWPALLEKRLAGDGCPYPVTNAGISGDTTAGGLARVETLLDRLEPVLLVVGLGANDGLRGRPVERMRQNLEGIVRAARAREVAVLLVGMRIPPNYGPAYAEAFHAVYQEVAALHSTALIPFLLEPIATDTSYFLEDGLHPNAAGQRRVLDHVMRGMQAHFTLDCENRGH